MRRLGRHLAVRRLAWRYLRERKGRATLTLLGVAVGVASIFAVAVANASTFQSFEEMLRDVSGRAELEIVASGDEGLPASLVGRVARTPGVGAAAPLVSRHAIALSPRGSAPAGRFPLLVLGVDPAAEGAIRQHRLAAGRLPRGRREIALVDDYARSLGVALGQELAVVAGPGQTRLTVVGLLRKEGPGRYMDGAVGLVAVELAQDLYGLGRKVDAVQLTLAPGATEAAVRAALAPALPASAVLQLPASRGRAATQWLASTSVGLQYFSSLSIFLGAFVIYNTFAMTVAERRRDLAMLRALGATRRQVLALVLAEAALLGAAGSLVGLAVGLALSRVFIAGMAALLAAPMDTFVVPAWGAALAAGTGLATSLVAALLPARAAATVSPLESLRAADRHRRFGGPAWLAGGLATLALGSALFDLFLRGPAPFIAGLAGGLIWLGGVVLLLRGAFGPLVALATAPVRWLFGTPGLLAQRYLLRSPGRTWLTISALAVAIAIAQGLGSSTQSAMDALARWLSSTISADFFVRASIPDPNGGQAVQLDETLQQQVARVPGVGSVDKLRFLRAQGPDGDVVVMAKSFSPGARLAVTLEEGSEAAVRQGLASGGVVVATPLAQRYGLRPGGELRLRTSRGPRSFRVVGVSTEFTNSGNALYVEWETARREFGLSGVDVFLVTTAPGAAPDEVERGLRAIADRQGLLLQSSRELHAYISGLTAGMIGFYWVIALIAMVVASLGIVNTQTTSVVDRTRELAMLRAIAARRGQVQAMILAEGLAVALAAAVVGGLAGIVLAYVFTAITNKLNGYGFGTVWSPAYVVGTSLLTLALALVASALPARRAASVPIVTTIKQE